MIDTVQPQYFRVGTDRPMPTVRRALEKQLAEAGHSDARIFESIDIFHDYLRVEADFIVLVPGYPVILLEVKDPSDGFTLSRKAHYVEYAYIDPKTKAKKGAPKNISLQIKLCGEALRNWLVDISRIHSFEAGTPSFISFLYTPNFEFDDDSILHSNVVHRTLDKRDQNRLVAKIIQHAREQGSSSSLSENRRGRWKPVTTQDAELLTRIICGEPGVRQWVSESSKRQQLQVLQLDAQFDKLDALRNNRNLYIEGASGTGKTALALRAWNEWAAPTNRAALVLRSNRTLGSGLSRIQPKRDSMHVVTDWDRLVEELWPGRSVPKSVNQTQDRWTRIALRLQAIKSGLSNQEKFDCIILDDVQDVPTNIVELLRETLSARGSFILLGDSSQELESGFRPGKSPLTRVELRHGFRATTAIGAAVATATNNNPGSFTQFSLSGPMPKYEKVPASNLVSTAEVLVNAIQNSRGWKLPQIAVLSMTGNSLKSGTGDIADVVWTSVENFRGNEADVVVLLLDQDITTDKASDDWQIWQTLTYIGIGRARDELYVLEASGEQSLLSGKVLACFEPLNRGLLGTDVGAKESPRV